MNSFESHLVALVRKMSDESILELVANQLAGAGAFVARVTPAARKAAIRAGAKGKGAPRGGRRGRVRQRISKSSDQYKSMLDKVEQVIVAGKGMSASEVAKATGIAQPRVAALIKALKLSKRIAQGGDRRFARYAKTAAVAKAASLAARKSA